MRKKTVLAIAFASGLLNSALPAISEDKSRKSAGPNSTDTVIQQITDSAKLTPEMRAYCLLMIASSYLGGNDKSSVDPQYAAVANGTTSVRSFFYRISRSWEDTLVFFAEQTSQDHSTIQRSRKVGETSNSLSIPDENVVLAATAIESALSQLDQVSYPFQKWNMYFIAGNLYQKMDKVEGTQKCNKLLEEAFRSCEVSPPADENQVRAAVSILNTMTNAIIAVRIPDRVYDGPEQQIKPFIEQEFEAAEKLKLRAVKMVDLLPADAHLRRKTHRDLYFWYAKLGKIQLAAKEKQALFQLVGTNDDSILYPHSGGCSSLVWWTKDNGITAYDCGRG